MEKYMSFKQKILLKAKVNLLNLLKIKYLDVSVSGIFDLMTRTDFEKV